MGFDYFYGFVGGDASQWKPNLFRNTTAIYPFEGNPVEARKERPALPKPSAEERKEASVQRALDQEKARTRLRDLKRAQTRESKHFVNVPLDYETKMRLQKASFDNDLKMTVIMKAAIDQYLRDNGY